MHRDKWIEPERTLQSIYAAAHPPTTEERNGWMVAAMERQRQAVELRQQVKALELALEAEYAAAGGPPPRAPSPFSAVPASAGAAFFASKTSAAEATARAQAIYQARLSQGLPVAGGFAGPAAANPRHGLDYGERMSRLVDAAAKPYARPGGTPPRSQRSEAIAQAAAQEIRRAAARQRLEAMGSEETLNFGGKR